MRAALQIEAKHDMALCPARQALDRGIAEEVGNRKQAHNQRRQQRRQRFPSRKIEHSVRSGAPQLLVSSSLTGSPLARTSLTIERICRTRTPSATSISTWSSSTTLVTRP